MSEPRLISKAVLQRGGTIIELSADQLRGQPNFDFSTEELVGSITAGKADISVWLRGIPDDLHDRPGGILYQYNPETEDLSLQLFIEKYPRPVWYGFLYQWGSGQGDQTIDLYFDGGLEIYRRRQTITYFPNPVIGRYYRDLVTAMIPGTVFDVEDIIYDDLAISYLEHPERRWCTGQSTHAPDPSGRIMALAINGNTIYMVSGLDIISYNKQTHIWTYHKTISDPDLLAIGGLGWQALDADYHIAPVPHLEFLLTRIPDGTMVRGTSPNERHSEVYQMEINL
jgi:hypothetical protein